MNYFYHFLKKGVAFSFLLSLSNVVVAGPYTVAKNRACPDSWALTDKAIPVVYSTVTPWGVPANGVNDKAIGKTHLSGARPIQTIEKTSVTNDDLINDPLTVASECLVYRNIEVDTWNYVAPPKVILNTSISWMPVVIF